MKWTANLKHALVFCLLISTSPGRAGESVSLGFGYTEKDMEVYRLGYRIEWTKRWFETGVGSLNGYHEFSMNYWHWPDNGMGGSDGATGGFYSPVFTYDFGDGQGITPYIELGIGVGLISDTHIGGRNMSSAFQFEDRLGIGIEAGDHDVVIRYIHYSNGGIKQPNSGMDILMAAYTWTF